MGFESILDTFWKAKMDGLGTKMPLKSHKKINEFLHAFFKQKVDWDMDLSLIHI